MVLLLNVVTKPDEEEHHNQSKPSSEGNLWLDGEKPGGDDEALEGDHQELGEGDQVPGAGVLVDHQLEEDDVGHASNEHHQDGQLGLEVHGGC